MRPRVSIGMPVYNGERFMRAAILSILRQTYTDFELIIADNASTDNTEAICREFAARDQRIRYVRNATNLGAAPNWNLLFELARGEYFKWHAYDDTLAPEFLERCVKVLDEDNSIVLCHTKTRRVDLEGHFTPSFDPPRRLDSHSLGERFRDLVIETHHINELYGVVRSDVLKHTSLHEPYFGNDKPLLAELIIRGRFYEVPEYLFFRGAYAGSASLRKTRTMREKWMGAEARIAFPEIKYLTGYMKAIWSVPLSFSDRVRCHAVMLVYLFGWSPWKRRVRRMLGLKPIRHAKAGL